MLSRADELTAERRALMETIVKEESALKRYRNTGKAAETIAAQEAYIDHLYARKIRLEGQIERESARLVRPEGPCVTLESNGVEWKV